MSPKPCVMCGKPAQAATDFCAGCYKGLEDRYRPKEEAPPRPPRDWRWAGWVLSAACLAVLASRLPSVTRTFAPPKPFRSGPADTDRATDECLRRLWTVSRLIQEGRWPVEGFACPATGRPYLSQGEGSGLTVRCPSPEAHRMAELSIGRKRPVPEARR